MYRLNQLGDHLVLATLSIACSDQPLPNRLADAFIAHLDKIDITDSLPDVDARYRALYAELASLGALRRANQSITIPTDQAIRLIHEIVLLSSVVAQIVALHESSDQKPPFGAVK